MRKGAAWFLAVGAEFAGNGRLVDVFLCWRWVTAAAAVVGAGGTVRAIGGCVDDDAGEG
jgi:hypothetical protein